jgi:hypothetical protein
MERQAAAERCWGDGAGAGEIVGRHAPAEATGMYWTRYGMITDNTRRHASIRKYIHREP